SSVEKAHHAIRRLRPLLHPGPDLFKVELEPLGLFLREQRIEIAEPFNEAAVARRTVVGDDDMIDRPLFCAGTGGTNNKRHPFQSFLTLLIKLTSFFRVRAAGRPAIRETFRQVRADLACSEAAWAWSAAKSRLCPARLAATARRAFVSPFPPSAPVTA